MTIRCSKIPSFLTGTFSIAIVCGALAFSGSALSQETVETELPEVREQLLQRVQRDQAARKEMIESQRRARAADKKAADKKIDNKIFERVGAIDSENRAWLKGQIELHGWLGKSKVGVDGAHAAWLLAQHADGDLEFQKQCLALMEAAGVDEVSAQDLAYLTDRVLNAEGKPQRYGTQIGLVNGEFLPQKVEDPENLDNRRKAIGLPPMSEYLEKIKEVYRLNSDK